MCDGTEPTPKVDADCDGLIEIDSLDDLNNIRYNLAGTSSKTASTAGGDGNTNGCPMEGCNGYELMNDLDFDPENDGHNNGEPYYNSGAGWQPIGTDAKRFVATFDGRGHAIANLFIERSADDFVGLFGAMGDGGEIRNLGVVDATVTGSSDVGGLVGDNDGGTVRASYAQATVTGLRNDVGGLVGDNGGTVSASYALATVSGISNSTGGLVGANGGTVRASYALATVTGGRNNVGGLVGDNDGGRVDASYALATVSGQDDVGGLVGDNDGTVRASYALATVTGRSNVGGLLGLDARATAFSYFDATFAGAMSLSDSASSRTTSQLQTPEGYGNDDAIYATWDDADLDSDGTTGDEWNFGSTMQYPALVLPPLATGACPVAISPAVMIGMAEGQCIHRPVSRFASVELDDDRGARFDGSIFTNKRNPRLTAQLLLPVDSMVTVRVVAGMDEVSTPTQTDSDGRVTLTVNLTEEDPNVFDAVWMGVSLGALTITLDRTTPTLTVYEEKDGRIRATAEDDDNPAPTIRYARLDRASSDTCTQGHFSGRDLTDLKPYDQNPANADDRLLDALVPDSEGNVGVYCFVAEDAAGNRKVESSADAVPAPVAAPAPVALRLRLRVFLESALP